MNLILIGFMGSGKTSVAKELGRRLGIASLDMDDLVYKKTRCIDMNEVFAKGGELLLRETEIQIAKTCAAEKKQIISCGGGVVLNKIIFDYFRRGGAKVIFLHASFGEIARRLASDKTRPLFRDVGQAEELYRFRLPLYMRYADETVSVDGLSVEEIAQQIQRRIGTYGI